jgi:hypothetical protein
MTVDISLFASLISSLPLYLYRYPESSVVVLAWVSCVMHGPPPSPSHPQLIDGGCVVSVPKVL